MSRMIMAPLPAGVPDTPEVRQRLAEAVGERPVDLAGFQTLEKEFRLGEWQDKQEFVNGLTHFARDGWKLHSWNRIDGVFYAVFERN